MDATPSANGNGFDAALRALEDLETSVAQAREEAPAVAAAPAPVAPATPTTQAIEQEASPVPAADPVDELAGKPGKITAVPIIEIGEVDLEPEAETEAADPAPVLHPIAEPAAPIPAAAAAPSAVPAIAAAHSPGKFIYAAVGLGLLSSLISAAGLVVAERTIMSAELVVADARERQEQLEHAGKLIDQLKQVRDKQVELLKAQQAQLDNGPVTSTELQHRMETLQKNLMDRDPMTSVVKAMNASDSNINARFSEIGMKLDRVEQGSRGGGGH